MSADRQNVCLKHYNVIFVVGRRLRRDCHDECYPARMNVHTRKIIYYSRRLSTSVLARVVKSSWYHVHNITHLLILWFQIQCSKILLKLLSENNIYI